MRANLSERLMKPPIWLKSIMCSVKPPLIMRKKEWQMTSALYLVTGIKTQMTITAKRSCQI